MYNSSLSGMNLKFILKKTHTKIFKVGIFENFHSVVIINLDGMMFSMSVQCILNHFLKINQFSTFLPFNGILRISFVNSFFFFRNKLI